MKKGVIVTVAVAVVTAVASLVVFASAPKTVQKVADGETKNNILTVSDSNTADASKVLETRFLNMLNRNFVYDDSFHTVESVVNNSVIALLDMRDNEDDSFISQAIVSGFVYDMYGIEIEDFSVINAQFPQKDGYVFIIPRGYEIYTHQIIGMTENEDGSYTVTTNVTISSHDGVTVTETCETLFVKNEVSQFGYNIVYSNISSSASAI